MGVEVGGLARGGPWQLAARDRKSTRLNSSHGYISYAVFCLKKKKNKHISRCRRLSLSHINTRRRRNRIHRPQCSVRQSRRILTAALHMHIVLSGTPTHVLNL